MEVFAEDSSWLRTRTGEFWKGKNPFYVARGKSQ
jgi:hypothetical protein